MAGVKISELPTGSTLTGVELMELSQGGVSIQAPISSLPTTAAAIIAALGINAAVIPNGSAAAPGLALVNSPLTGLYRAGSNQLGFTAAGVSQGTFSTSGLTLPTALVMNGDGSGTGTLKYPARVDNVTNEIFWTYTGDATNSGPGTQHLDTDGISAIPFRGSDNYEHAAIGSGNSGSGAPWANSTFLEASHFPQQSTTAPPPLKFVQTGYNSVAAGYDNTRRQIFTADYNIEFYDALNIVQQKITPTGQWQSQNGTAAAPAFSFINDPDTGGYNAGANAYGIAGGGKLAVQIDGPGSSSFSWHFEANNQPILSTTGPASSASIFLRGFNQAGVDLGSDKGAGYIARFQSGTNPANYLVFQSANSGANPSMAPSSGANMILGGVSLATNATSGFMFIPGCNGTPTGTPANWSNGSHPLIVDYANNKLYFYSTGAWRDAGP